MPAAEQESKLTRGSMLRKIFESCAITALLRLWQRDSWRIEFLNLLKELLLRSECAETVDIRDFRTFIYLSKEIYLYHLYLF